MKQNLSSANEKPSRTSKTESQKTQQVSEKEKKPTQSSSKTRLKKDNFIVYKDMDESPIKQFPVRQPRSKILTKEEEEELNHLSNITKETKEVKDSEEEDYQKPMRKVKTNRIQKYEDICLKPRSPPKVAMRLRIPLCERNYSLRNREAMRNKDIV